jgi:NAD(P)-dependent dehydrogenase (short-subunit alcohol dehydrogenase family)
MNTKNLAGEVRVVTGASKGIGAAVIRLIRRRSVVDIVERFQTQHALQEEREMKNSHPSINGATAPGVIDKNGMATVPPRKESSPSHGGLIVGRFRLSV